MCINIYLNLPVIEGLKTVDIPEINFNQYGWFNLGINLLGLEDISVQLGVPENLTINFNIFSVVYALDD